jgi:hypothetical protein
MNDHYIKNDCRLCKSKDLKIVLPLMDSPLCDAYLREKRTQNFYPLVLELCVRCGFVQINCVVEPETIYRDYIYMTTSSSGLKLHFQSYASEVFKLANCPQSFVVDIGSNDGTLLSFFQQKNCLTLGIEPSIVTANNATKNGIETLAEFFNLELSKEIVKKYGYADIITINNLFANIDDLYEFTHGLEALLDENGILVIESSYLLDMINNMVFDFAYHEHLSYFSIVPLVRFFKQFGIKLIRVEHVITKGGSLRYYWAKDSSNRPVDVSVEAFIRLEERSGIDEGLFERFNSRIQEAKIEIIHFLEEEKNITIYAFGASATSTTLISHFGLDPYISVLIDDNLRKIGTYSPGYHIPVKSIDYLCENPPDVVVILAWRFQEEILKKISHLNCKIVSPLPAFKLLN